MSCKSMDLAALRSANEQRCLVAAAKQRDQDQHRNGYAEQPQQHISHPALLLVGPVGTQSRKTFFHDICPLVDEVALHAGEWRRLSVHGLSQRVFERKIGWMLFCMSAVVERSLDRRRQQNYNSQRTSRSCAMVAPRLSRSRSARL